jgi:uncharacterized membrane protein YkvA (DUF1232 family)
MSLVDYCKRCNTKDGLQKFDEIYLCEGCSNENRIVSTKEPAQAEVIQKYQGFFHNLVRDINNYEGDYKEILSYCPKFFKLLCDILRSKRTDWHTKLLINSALAYFVLPEDIIPDYDPSGKGYIDDLFLTAFVLVEIKTNIDESLLKENWEYEEDILELIEEIHDKTKIILGDQYIDVLRLVGLKKYVSLDLNEYNGEYPKKIARLAQEKRELLGLLSFVVSKIYRIPRIREYEKIKEFLYTHEEYGEIERILEIATERKNQWEPNTKKVNPIADTYSALRRKRIEKILKERIK